MGLQASFQLANLEYTALKWKQPRAFPVSAAPNITDAEKEVLGDYYLDRYKTSIAAAFNDGDSERVWQLFNAAAEDYLESRCHDADQAQGTRGRGLTPQFVLKTVAPGHCVTDLGATDKTQQQYFQLTVLLRQLGMHMAKLEKPETNVEEHEIALLQTRWAKCRALAIALNVEASKVGRELHDFWNHDIPASTAIWDAHKHIKWLEADYKCYIQKAWVKIWKQCLRAKGAVGLTAAARKIKEGRNDSSVAYLRDPQTGRFTASVPEMFQIMERAWLPIFNLRAHEFVPDWATFQREFQQDFPARQNISIEHFTGIELYKTLQKRPDKKAGSFDGWTTREAKDLPLVLVNVAALVFELIETGAEWPAAFTQVPNPQLRKGAGEDPRDTRGLSLLSVWHSSWAKARYHHPAMNKWRIAWTPPNMYGARKKSTIQDVSLGAQLLLELARLMGKPLGMLFLDKEKCYDRMIFAITLGLQGFVGCPARLLRARGSFAIQARRRFKLKGFYSSEWAFTNGDMQGDVFAVDDVCLLTSAWQRYMQRILPNQRCSTFYDDSSISFASISEACDIARGTNLFDTATCQKTNASKTIAVATTSDLAVDLTALRIGGAGVQIQDGAKLTGAFVIASGAPDSTLQDKRVCKAIDPIRRIGSLPLARQLEGQIVAIFASSVFSTGLELNLTSENATK